MINQPDHAARVAMVTGGGSGIGRAVCLSLAGAGHRVAVADLNIDSAINTAARITGSGGSAVGVAMDVTSDHSVGQGTSKRSKNSEPSRFSSTVLGGTS